jgi:hypothetical protein
VGEFNLPNFRVFSSNWSWKGIKHRQDGITCLWGLAQRQSDFCSPGEKQSRWRPLECAFAGSGAFVWRLGRRWELRGRATRPGTAFVRVPGWTRGDSALILRFCRFCVCCSNNMLYPSQDREIRRLMFRCRNCGQSEEVEENCIYANELVKDTRCVRLVSAVDGGARLNSLSPLTGRL